MPDGQHPGERALSTSAEQTRVRTPPGPWKDGDVVAHVAHFHFVGEKGADVKADYREMNSVGEPYAGTPHVRFDGGALESGHHPAPALYATSARMTGVRG